MAIKYRPKVGEILECDFGRWQEIDGKSDYDRNLEPEMRKRRMVVVLNGDIDGKSAIVAPISSTKGYGRLATFHVYLSPDLIPETYFYDVRERWVKRNIPVVSVLRDCLTF
ncbi:type II toxin-antitoxin system PemK/MazF family toxin [Haemophilus paracuniculus]|uniref:type II toxin-antitoxin system PemK/MazF family toxin n=1 Tax=Haemophilus paracuniculus TaxID=734 RepID=UPI00099489FE|nr:type II toxin-antitoxin system PemK/MazF family toxin [Haemophilus paracuniculus]